MMLGHSEIDAYRAAAREAGAAGIAIRHASMYPAGSESGVPLA